MIKVLIVDDSKTVRFVLSEILSSDPDIQLIGLAGNGEEALSILERKKPDIITMDINMPGINGFEITRKIMETRPVPIVIVSSYCNSEDSQMTFKAIEAGAVGILEKPFVGHQNFEEMKKNFIHTLKLMSEIKVITRWTESKKEKILSIEKRSFKHTDIKVVAIGASIGGPFALRSVLAGLSPGISVPVLIVQHIARGFIEGMIEWLKSDIKLPLHLAAHNMKPEGGHIYFAPDDYQMEVGKNGSIILRKEVAHRGICPSVSSLFSSVADVYGSRAIGVLLTGMGTDGSAELKLMRDKGAITIAQDKETSVVHGMPGEAIRLGGAVHILPPQEIALLIMKLVK
jgi:two-component system, chemotaxis family, protein-glutamate methylesterase/glutaminase